MKTDAIARMLVIEYPSLTKDEIDKKSIVWLYDYYLENSKLQKFSQYGYSYTNKNVLDFCKKYIDEEFNEDISDYSVKSKYLEMISKDESLSEKFVNEYPSYESFEVTVSLEDYMDLTFKYSDKITFKIKNRMEIKYQQETIIENSTASLENAVKLVQKNIEMFDKQMNSLKEISSHHYNLMCNSPVSDNFLSSVNQIKLLEDICSDELQKNLCDGWRIIAICPQPNQRRPDYILGKSVPLSEMKDSAMR